MSFDGRPHDAPDAPDAPLDPPPAQREDADEAADLALMSQGLNVDGTPRRPMNAFMLYARKRRPQVAQVNQHLRTGQISKLLSKEWAELSPEDKRYYQDLAKRLKDEFTTRHPDYVYRRRPNNSKKRRGREHQVGAGSPRSNPKQSLPPFSPSFPSPHALSNLNAAGDLEHQQRSDEDSDRRGHQRSEHTTPPVASSSMPAPSHVPATHVAPHPRLSRRQSQTQDSDQYQQYRTYSPATSSTTSSTQNASLHHLPLSMTSRHVPQLYPVQAAPGPASAVSTTYSSGAPSPISLHGQLTGGGKHQHQQALHQDFPLLRDSSHFAGPATPSSVPSHTWVDYPVGRAPPSGQHSHKPGHEYPVRVDSPATGNASFPMSAPPFASSSQQLRQQTHSEAPRLQRIGSLSQIASPSFAAGPSSAPASLTLSTASSQLSDSPDTPASHVNQQLHSMSYPPSHTVNIRQDVYSNVPGPGGSAGSSAQSSATHSPVTSTWSRSDPGASQSHPPPRTSPPHHPHSAMTTNSPVVAGPGGSYPPGQPYQYSRADLDMQLPHIRSIIPPPSYGQPSEPWGDRSMGFAAATSPQSAVNFHDHQSYQSSTAQQAAVAHQPHLQQFVYDAAWQAQARGSHPATSPAAPRSGQDIAAPQSGSHGPYA